MPKEDSPIFKLPTMHILRDTTTPIYNPWQINSKIQSTHDGSSMVCSSSQNVSSNQQCPITPRSHWNFPSIYPIYLKICSSKHKQAHAQFWKIVPCRWITKFSQFFWVNPDWKYFQNNTCKNCNVTPPWCYRAISLFRYFSDTSCHWVKCIRLV